MSVHGASKRIVETLLTWDGVEAHPHRFGGTEFRIGRREIGHLHGDYLVDIPFPKKVRDEIIANGLASRTTFCRRRAGSVSIYATKMMSKRQLNYSHVRMILR